MLVGITGIDFVLIIIAADDGIMPQTKEHINILSILGIRRGIVVLTKIDIVDAEWKGLVKETIKEYLLETPFKDSTIIEVSSLTGEGFEELLDSIEEEIKYVEVHREEGNVRLAIDRVFTMQGFGIVVTGSLWNGKLSINDKLEVNPGEHKVRVRGIEVHGEKREHAYAGERVAVNIIGVDKEFVNRGSWLGSPDYMKESMLVDVEIEMLNRGKTLSQRDRVHVHHGAMQALGRVNLLDCDRIEKGNCYAQLLMESPLFTLPGDRLVIRSYSPVDTICGAVVLNNSTRKKKRFNPDVIEYFKYRTEGGNNALILHTINEKNNLMSIDEISKLSGIEEKETREIIDFLIKEKQLILLSEKYVTSSMEEKWWALFSEAFNQYSQKYPLHRGINKQEIQSQLFCNLDSREFSMLLSYWKEKRNLYIIEQLIAPTEYNPSLTIIQKGWIDAIMNNLNEASFAPRTFVDIAKDIGISEKERSELQYYLTQANMIVMVDNDIAFARSSIEAVIERIKEESENGEFTLSQLREWLGTSRKYVFLIAEQLAKENRTHRVEDIHVLL